jgi:hypothetical protein
MAFFDVADNGKSDQLKGYNIATKLDSSVFLREAPADDSQSNVKEVIQVQVIHSTESDYKT